MPGNDRICALSSVAETSQLAIFWWLSSSSIVNSSLQYAHMVENQITPFVSTWWTLRCIWFHLADSRLFVAVPMIMLFRWFWRLFVKRFCSFVSCIFRFGSWPKFVLMAVSTIYDSFLSNLSLVRDIHKVYRPWTNKRPLCVDVSGYMS